MNRAGLERLALMSPLEGLGHGLVDVGDEGREGSELG
jgi:hypothetical protein